jgi:hypothetical protein
VDVFRKSGDYWILAFDGSVVHLRDAKGLHYVARLLASPDQRLPAYELMCSSDAGRGAAERARSAVTKRIKDAIRRIHACHPALGRHLMRTVKTGCACVYQADPDRPTRWVLS